MVMDKCLTATASHAFSLVDIVSIFTSLGAIIFGIFRRDLLMLVACVSLVALTQQYQHLNHESVPLFVPPPVTEASETVEWWTSILLKYVSFAEATIRHDWSRTIMVSMFIMLAIASLFRGTASNFEINLSDEFQTTPTSRRTFVKTRFFVGCTILYTLLMAGISILITQQIHLPLLELFSPSWATQFNPGLCFAAHRTLEVITSKYYTEIVVLLGLISYDQDAHTSISFSVVIAFLPTLMISLARHLCSSLISINIMVPHYLIWNEDQLNYANYACLIFAHFIMYIAWLKTLKEWKNELDLFRMRYDFISRSLRDTKQQLDQASKHVLPSEDESHDSSNGILSPSSIKIIPSGSMIASRSLSEVKSIGSTKGNQAQLPNTHQVPLSISFSNDVQKVPATTDENEDITHKQVVPYKIPPRLSQLKQAAHQTSSGALLGLDCEWESLDHISLAGLLQLKLKVPGILPFDEATKVVCYCDTELTVWSLKDQLKLRTLIGHTKPISLVRVINHPQRRIISSSWDCTVKIWNLETGELESTLSDFPSGITSFSLYDNNTKLIVGTSTGFVSRWDLKSFLQIDAPTPCSTHTISGAWMLPDQIRFVATCFKGLGYVWNISTGMCERILKRHRRRILDAALYNHGTRLITASEDHKLIIWDLEADNPVIHELDGHDASVHSVCVYGDGQRAISGSYDGMLIIWNLNPGENEPLLVTRLEDHRNAAIISINPFDDHQYISSYAMDRVLKIWNMKNRECFNIKLPPELTTPSDTLHSSNNSNLNLNPINKPGIGVTLTGFPSTIPGAQNYESLFSTFVPVRFFDLISPLGRDRLKLGDAVCKQITVMFTDIRDFSSMAENMSVDVLMHFLNTYLAFALPPIYENGGFVDKFIGDSIMGVFPHDDEHKQTWSAVTCAVAIMQSLDFMKNNGFPASDTGIGINTGTSIIGLIGAETRMEPTVLGDTVNLASRLESLCKTYGSRVLITEYTVSSLGRHAEEFTLRLLDRVTVKGKTQPCRIYEVINACSPDVWQTKCGILQDGLWESAMNAYQDAKFSEAATLFKQCLDRRPEDVPSKLYLRRCNDLISKEMLPQNWDGVYRLDTK